MELEEQLKADTTAYAVILEALGHFANTLTAFHTFEKKYGLKASAIDTNASWFRPSSNQPGLWSDDVFNIPNAAAFWSQQSQSNFQDALLTFQKRTSNMKKFTWAISDKARFSELVDTLRSLNDGLSNTLPRIRQNALDRALIGGQPLELAALRRLIEHKAISDDYVAAALFRSKFIEQRQNEMTTIQVQGIAPSQANPSGLALDSLAITPRGQKEAKLIGELAGRNNLRSKVLIEHKTLRKQDTVFFDRFLRLTELLRTSPKPSAYRILDCEGYARDDYRSDERYALVFSLPPFLKNAPSVTYHTLHELLRPKDDNATPANLVLAERYRLAGLLAASIVHIHFAGWLHRALESRNIICFSSGDQISIQHPYMSGFEFTRPDKPGEISQYDQGTTSNLYRHPDYQLPSPAQKFRRSYELYSLGVILIEIGFWQRISAFRTHEHPNATDFSEHLRTSVLPLLAFHMGTEYVDAVSKCLDTSKLGCGVDEGNYLSSTFSKNVVQALEGCYIR